MGPVSAARPFGRHTASGLIWAAVSIVALIAIFKIAGYVRHEPTGLPVNDPVLSGTGVIIIGILLAFIGMYCAAIGIISRRSRMFRLAFTVLGGFFVAGLVVLADLFVKHLS